MPQKKSNKSDYGWIIIHPNNNSPIFCEESDEDNEDHTEEQKERLNNILRLCKNAYIQK